MAPNAHVASTFDESSALEVNEAVGAPANDTVRNRPLGLAAEDQVLTSRVRSQIRP
jgi:hypothetical protein